MRFEEMTVSPTATDRRRLHDELGALLGEHAEALRDRATLLVTELLTGHPSVPTEEERLTIRIFADSTTVRVEVHDGGHGAVLRRIRRTPGVDARGWNPHLMNRVADRWGLVSDREGAWVWFELGLEEGE
jgi:hypothetical protein